MNIPDVMTSQKSYYPTMIVIRYHMQGSIRTSVWSPKKRTQIIAVRIVFLAPTWSSYCILGPKMGTLAAHVNKPAQKRARKMFEKNQPHCETSSPSKVQVTKSKPNKRFRFNPDTSQHQRKLGKPFAQTTQATQGKVVDT